MNKPLPTIRYNGATISARDAGTIAKRVGGIDSADMVSIFERAVRGEAEAREEFEALTEIEIIG